MAGSGRIIALDIGTVRIGVAASDPLGCFAQGITVLQASSDWMEALDGIVAEFRANVILVGMPRRTDGSDGPEAGRMKKVLEKLERRFPQMEVISWDERFTTTIAQQALLEADVSRKGRKQQVDKIAAVVLLQSYLDSFRGSEKETGPPDLPVVFTEELSKLSRSGKQHQHRKKRAYD